MSLPLTINTIPAEHGAVEHQLVDAVGWIHARLYNCSDADADAVATAVRSALEGRPTPVPVFDIPAALAPLSPDLADDLQAVGYVEGWNACAQLMRKGVEDSERMVSMASTSPRIALPRWVPEMALRIANYMESQHNAEWAIGRIMSRRPECTHQVAIDHVRSILLTIASSARDDAAVTGAKRALDILDGQAEKAPLPDPNEGDFDCPKAAQARACPCGFCVALRSGPPAPAVTSMAHPDFGMQSRSNAWERVAKTLGEVSPSWITSSSDMSGIDCAVAEIKALAKAAESAVAGMPAGWKFVRVADHIQIRLPNSEGFCEVMPSDGIIFRLAEAMLAETPQPAPAAVNQQLTAGETVRADLVPGVMRCAKCNFQVHRVVLYMGNGAVGAGNSKTEPCPNGCGPLWPVTWPQWATEAHEYAERLQSELAALKAAQSNAVSRTDQEIVRQTEELAALFMLEIYSRESVDAGYIFRDARDPRGKHCWQLACRVQEMLTDTDPENAVSESAYIEAKSSPSSAGSELPVPGDPFDYGSLTIPAAAREALARECGTEGIPINQADEE